MIGLASTGVAGPIKVDSSGTVTLGIGQHALHSDISRNCFNSRGSSSKSNTAKINSAGIKTAVCITKKSDGAVASCAHIGLQTNTIVKAGHTPAIHLDIATGCIQGGIADQNTRRAAAPVGCGVQSGTLRAGIVTTQSDIASIGKQAGRSIQRNCSGGRSGGYHCGTTRIGSEGDITSIRLHRPAGRQFDITTGVEQNICSGS